MAFLSVVKSKDETRVKIMGNPQNRNLWLTCVVSGVREKNLEGKNFDYESKLSE